MAITWELVSSNIGTGYAVFQDYIRIPGVFEPPSTGGSEGETQIKMPFAATLANLYVRVTTNSMPDDFGMFVRVNGANTALAVTIPAGTDGVFQDTTNSISVAAGDLVAVGLHPGIGVFTISVMGLTMYNPNDERTIWVASALTNGGEIFDSVTLAYTGVFGRNVANAIEADNQWLVRRDGNLNKLRVFVKNNTATGDTTVTLRKNSANTALSVTIGAGATGNFEDNTNVIAVTDGDLLNYKVTVPDNNIRISVMQMVSDAEVRPLVALGASLTIVADAYVPIEGNGGTNQTTTESISQIAARSNFTANHLQVNVPANSTTGATVVYLRKNSANTALSVTIPAGAPGTGIFENFADDIVFAPGDTMNYFVDWGGGGGISLLLIGIDTGEGIFMFNQII